MIYAWHTPSFTHVQLQTAGALDIRKAMVVLPSLRRQRWLKKLSKQPHAPFKNRSEMRWGTLMNRVKMNDVVGDRILDLIRDPEFKVQDLTFPNMERCRALLDFGPAPDMNAVNIRINIPCVLPNTLL